MININDLKINIDYIIEDRGYISPCHIWSHALDSKGYAIYTNYFKQTIKVFRFIYEKIHGKIKDKKELDHKCNVHACINDEHMQPVTHKENMKLSYSRDNRQLAGTALKQIYCQRGHELTEDNVYKSKGKRTCKTCRKMTSNQRYATT